MNPDGLLSLELPPRRTATEMSSPRQGTASSSASSDLRESLIPTPSIPQAKKGLLVRRIGESKAALVKGVGIGLSVAIIVFVAVIGFLTLLHVDVIVGDVQNAQTNHSDTLKSINTVSQNLARGDTTVGSILKEASSEEQKLQKATEINNANQLLICSNFHITGCTPLPS
jgi:hypothetical protein